MKAKPRRGSTGLRIIGGEWRGRRFEVADAPDLRPTPDRVRETLFNWLAPWLPGAYCLDAFAGTGALGLEALSRGAAHCVFVEPDPVLARGITGRLRALNADARATVIQGRWPEVAARVDRPPELVFLDPPFQQALLPSSLTALAPMLGPSHRVYLEYPADQPPALDSEWQSLREKKAGRVGYALIARKPTGTDRRAAAENDSIEP